MDAMAPGRPLGNVLVATDFSAAATHAVERAARLPLARGSTLTILHVYAPVYEPEEREAVARALDLAGNLATAGLKKSGVHVVTRVVPGVPFVEIVRAAREDGSELVVIGRHGRRSADSSRDEPRHSHLLQDRAVNFSSVRSPAGNAGPVDGTAVARGEVGMDIEIQTAQVELQPEWRVLIENRLERLGTRYPKLVRVHVTLKHGRHHRIGTEEVDIVANCAGATLRAAKQEEHMRDAVHAALDALERELVTHHELGARGPQASRVFRVVERSAT